MTSDHRAAVTALFQPRSVAVVGASPTRKSARQPLQNLLVAGFAGQMAAVNPRYSDVLGIPCFPSLEETPFVPDAIAVVVNHEKVVPVIESAAQRGVKAAVVFAMGFADAGAEGRRLQERLASVARAAGMAVVGPNCLGLINFRDGSPLFIEDLHEGYRPGPVGLIAQSGSITMSLANNKRGVRWSHIVSCGNEAVTGAADLLAFMVDDPGTEIICLFLESIRQPTQFFEQCDRARQMGKPVVVLKSGKSEAGAAAATAHSGALAVPDRLTDALMRRHGVLRVDTLEELLETAIALQSPVKPKGGRVASIAASGAVIELILDQTQGGNLVHSDFGDSTVKRLRGQLPDFLEARNPLDWWGLPDYERTFPDLTATIAEDVDVDIIVDVTDFSYAPVGGINQKEHLAYAIERGPLPGKVMAVLETLDGSVPAEDVERGLASGVLVLSGIVEGYRALGNLVSSCVPPGPPLAARDICADELLARLSVPGMSISGQAGLDGLRDAGFDVPRSRLVADVEAAANAAQTIGFPVVVKSADPRHLHKTELGAVATNLGDVEAVRDATTRILETGADSVMVQEQVVGGVEVLLGVQAHPVLGGFLVVGLGGIWTEILDDVAIRPLGLRVGEAQDMLESLRGYPILTGARGSRPVAIKQLIDAIEMLDAVGMALSQVVEAIDINPIIVGEDRAVAVDALFVRSDAVLAVASQPERVAPSV